MLGVRFNFPDSLSLVVHLPAPGMVDLSYDRTSGMGQILRRIAASHVHEVFTLARTSRVGFCIDEGIIIYENIRHYWYGQELIAGLMDSCQATKETSRFMVPTPSEDRPEHHRDHGALCRTPNTMPMP
jgi:hypothetical protein